MWVLQSLAVIGSCYWSLSSRCRLYYIKEVRVIDVVAFIADLEDLCRISALFIIHENKYSFSVSWHGLVSCVGISVAAHRCTLVIGSPSWRWGTITVPCVRSLVSPVNYMMKELLAASCTQFLAMNRTKGWRFNFSFFLVVDSQKHLLLVGVVGNLVLIFWLLLMAFTVIFLFSSMSSANNGLKSNFKIANWY